MLNRTNFETAFIAGLSKLFPTARVSTVEPGLDGRDNTGASITVSLFPAALSDMAVRRLNVAIHAAADTRGKARELSTHVMDALENAVLSQELGDCVVHDLEILSGPYFNPLPDSRHRYTVNTSMVVKEYG